jgi:hypothetical protein
MQLLVKPTLSVHSTWWLKKGPSPHCQKNGYQYSWYELKLSELSLVPVLSGWGTATVNGEHTELPSVPHVSQLEFD